MTDAPKEQGPQALVLRSLLRAAALPGGRHPVSLGDLPLARTPSGSVRIVSEGLELDTAQAITSDPHVSVEISPADALVLDDDTGASAVLRSEVDYPRPDHARVRVDVCGIHSGQLTVWESFVAELVRTPDGWVAQGDPLHLAT